MPASATRVLVVSNEPLGERMAGPAIRALELARALAEHVRVSVAAPPASDSAPTGVELLEIGSHEFRRLLAAVREHDVVVAQSLPPQLLLEVSRLPVRLVADLYTPSVMEVLEAGRDAPDRVHRRLQHRIGRAALAQCAAADLIVCASERQRDLWLGGLALHGLIDLDAYRADPSLRSVIDVVPFGMPAAPPRPGKRPVLKGVWPGIGPHDRVLLWGGGIWNWLDALTPMRAVARLHEQRGGGVHLFFLGVRRPMLDPREQMSAGAQAVAYAREHGLEGRCVHFNHDWVPYEERGRWLLEADIGVSAHHDHLEARFSFRTRVLDYLWAGLPVVATRGDSLADLVERHGLGATVSCEDDAAFAAAVAALLDDDARRAAVSERIAARRPELTWRAAVEPLARFCAEGASRPARRRPRALIRRATLEQYPATLADTWRREGAGALVRRVARNLGRMLPGAR